jgi:predicted nucleic acid-binding protein
MSARFFLDTNVFVYSFDSGAKAVRANDLIRKAISSRDGVVSFQVVQEFMNVALRRFANPMTVSDAEQYLGTVFRPLLAIHSSQSLYGEALRLKGRYSFSWYDSLVVAAAAESECSILYSDDMQHGLQIRTLQIPAPAWGLNAAAGNKKGSYRRRTRNRQGLMTQVFSPIHFLPVIQCATRLSKTVVRSGLLTVVSPCNIMNLGT